MWQDLYRCQLSHRWLAYAFNALFALYSGSLVYNLTVTRSITSTVPRRRGAPFALQRKTEPVCVPAGIFSNVTVNRPNIDFITQCRLRKLISLSRNIGTIAGSQPYGWTLNKDKQVTIRATVFTGFTLVCSRIADRHPTQLGC